MFSDWKASGLQRSKVLLSNSLENFPKPDLLWFRFEFCSELFSGCFAAVFSVKNKKKSNVKIVDVLLFLPSFGSRSIIYRSSWKRPTGRAWSTNSLNVRFFRPRLGFHSGQKYFLLKLLSGDAVSSRLHPSPVTPPTLHLPPPFISRCWPISVTINLWNQLLIDLPTLAHISGSRVANRMD